MNRSTSYATASWDKTAWLVTLLCMGFLLGLSGTFVFGVIGHHSDKSVTVYLVMALAAGPLFLVAMFLFSPRGYQITDSAVVVSRLAPNIVIPLEDIASVEDADSVVFKGSIRVMACGGLFGYFGWFSCPAIGSFRAYVVRTDRLVILRRKRNKIAIVLSPADIQGFVEQLKERLPYA